MTGSSDPTQGGEIGTTPFEDPTVISSGAD